MAVVRTIHGDVASTVDIEMEQSHTTLIECRRCGEVKDKSQYAPMRRQCNRCRNRYTERVRDIEKRRAYGRVRAERYRLKKKVALVDMRPCLASSTQ